MTTLIKIYKCYDPITGNIYVGRTKRELNVRLDEHKRDSLHTVGKYPEHPWVIEALEECQESMASEREAHWIAQLTPALNIRRRNKVKYKNFTWKIEPEMIKFIIDVADLYHQPVQVVANDCFVHYKKTQGYKKFEPLAMERRNAILRALELDR